MWSVLQSENFKRGGEWIETRILNSGPRSNPWMQECGPRVIQHGDIFAFDTDLIGPYGMCADISRTWIVGDDKASDEQRRLYQVAHEHIQTNRELIKPGASFRELSFGGHLLPEEFFLCGPCNPLWGLAKWYSPAGHFEYLQAHSFHPCRPLCRLNSSLEL